MSRRAAIGNTLRHPSFRVAAVDMAGTAVGIGAWGLVTGVVMVKSGLPVGMAIFMSLVVYAGSAQLAVIPLMAVGAPLWVVWLTASCVNLRFVIFSSMWRSYFAHLPLRQRLAVGYFSGDVIYVAFMKRFPEPRPQPEQVPYFWGAASTNWLAWQVPSIAGILLANAVPLSWGLGFAGVLALLGVLLSLLFDRGHLAGHRCRRHGCDCRVCTAAQAQHPGGHCGSGGCGPLDGSSGPPPPQARTGPVARRQRAAP